MPDVELAVLRQTWSGRAAAGDARHKRRDWLSHRQRCRRTGRGSDAVSGAVASLARSGLLVVDDAAGNVLATPEERRRCLGRLYSRPEETWGVEMWKTAAPSGKTGNDNIALL